MFVYLPPLDMFLSVPSSFLLQGHCFPMVSMVPSKAGSKIRFGGKDLSLPISIKSLPFFWRLLAEGKAENNWFFIGFANAGFRDFEALDGPLGAHLGPSWADLVPKRDPKMAPIIVQKVSENWSKK